MSPELEAQILAELPRLQGWMTSQRALLLAKTITREKPQACLEIGTFGGQSAIMQALALKENGRGVLYCIDPWKKDDCLEGENDANRQWWSTVDLEEVHQGFMVALWRLGLDKIVIPIRAASHNCHGLFADESLDSLLIDGNHAEEPSCRDLQLYLPRLKKGGILICDDCDWPSTQKMMGIIREKCEKVSGDEHFQIYRKP